MKLLTLVFSILLISSFTHAADILFVIGTPGQIKSKFEDLQSRGACIVLNVANGEPQNGRDDDYNGYADDDRGFNFDTGQSVKNEFTSLFLAIGSTKVPCTNAIPIVIPNGFNTDLHKKIAQYILHSPLYVDALPGRTDLDPLSIFVSFPNQGDLFEVLFKALDKRNTPSTIFYYSPY